MVYRRPAPRPGADCSPWVLVAARSEHDTVHDTMSILQTHLWHTHAVPALVPWSPSPCCLVGGGCLVWWGGGGGGGGASIGPCPSAIPLGGADACTPRQGVTLLYGPSICTRFVQMDLRRSQVRRPFPTPGSGTLWVAGRALAWQA